MLLPVCFSKSPRLEWFEHVESGKSRGQEDILMSDLFVTCMQCGQAPFRVAPLRDGASLQQVMYVLGTHLFCFCKTSELEISGMASIADAGHSVGSGFTVCGLRPQKFLCAGFCPLALADIVFNCRLRFSSSLNQNSFF